MDASPPPSPPCRADFLGASGYASMNLQPTFNEMERTLQTVAYEMQFFGMSLKGEGGGVGVRV